MKKPWLAGLLNIVPGVGYLYLGKRREFAYLILVSVLLSVLEWIVYPEVYDAYASMPLTPIGLIWSLLFVAAFVTDAYLLARENPKKK